MATTILMIQYKYLINKLVYISSITIAINGNGKKKNIEKNAISHLLNSSRHTQFTFKINSLARYYYYNIVIFVVHYIRMCTQQHKRSASKTTYIQMISSI